MRYFTDTKLFDSIIREACEHRTLEALYRNSGYRDGYRDGVRDAARLTKETT